MLAASALQAGNCVGQAGSLAQAEKSRRSRKSMIGEGNMKKNKEIGIDRRGFLKGGLSAGVALAGGAGLVDRFGFPMVSAARASEPKRGGMLIHGIQGGSAGDSLDPFNVLSAADYARVDLHPDLTRVGA